MKSLKLITSLFLSLSFLSTPFLAAEETTAEKDHPKLYNTVNDAIDRATTPEKIEKFKAKLFKKIRRSLNEKKEAKLVNNISKSEELTTAQKLALLELLESFRAEIHAFPDDSAE